MANAEQRFDKALAIVTSDDLKAEQDRTQAQLEREAKLNRVRGDAFYGLRHWAKALACYQRVLQFQPDDRPTRRRVADALLQLKRPNEALAEHDKLIKELTRLVEKEGRAELAPELASSLSQRGGMLAVRGKNREAIADLDKAIAIRTKLVEKEGRAGLQADLATSLTLRGMTLRGLGRHADAVADLDKAVAIRIQLVEKEGRQDLAYPFSVSLTSRGGVLRDSGKLAEALADFDKAVRIRTRLVEKEGRKEFTADLARALDGRGSVHLDLCRLPEAVADSERAVTIFTDLVKKESRKELANALGGTQRRLDRAKTAVRAVKDIEVALKQPPQLAAELLLIRARALAVRGKHAEAAATGDKLLGLNPKAPYYLWWAARCHALAATAVAAGKKDLSAEDRAQQARHADKAIDLLRQAVGRGFKDVNRLRYEPDIASLRRRDDFKKLFAGVAEKARP